MSNDSTKDEEDSLFHTEMADVSPLKPDNKIKHKKKPTKAFQKSDDEIEDIAIDDVFSTAEIMDDCPDILSFSRSGLQSKVLKNLRQGKNPIEHSIDLHGLTIQQAKTELLVFLGECQAAGIRHATIVHGKGFSSKNKPVIKPMVNRWLRATENVLAFHSAQPKDGGSGALYVLLKNNN